MKQKVRSSFITRFYPGIAVGAMTRHEDDGIEDKDGDVTLEINIVMHELYIPFVVFRYTTVYIDTEDEKLREEMIKTINQV